LQSIRSFRIHLSDCGPGDGPLRVLPGSESQGLIDFGGLDRSAADDGIAILADAGDVLEFSPLCLHASDANQAGGMRAILHIEVSDYQFDNGLEWFGRIAI
jgi:ectoine hydroxylase-related dioxygenase (phytanoyl-CoA dioxygenase family)